MVGTMRTSGKENTDILAMRVDSSGHRVWMNQYGGDKDEVVFGIESTVDGDYLIGARTNSFGAGDLDLYHMLISDDGTKIQDGTFGGSGREVMWSMTPDNRGGFLSLGWSVSFAGDSVTLYLVRTDKSGSLSWERNLNLPGVGMPGTYEAVASRDGGFLIVGVQGVTKIDSSGYTMWETSIDWGFRANQFKIVRAYSPKRFRVLCWNWDRSNKEQRLFTIDDSGQVLENRLIDERFKFSSMSRALDGAPLLCGEAVDYKKTPPRQNLVVSKLRWLSGKHFADEPSGDYFFEFVHGDDSVMLDIDGHRAADCSYRHFRHSSGSCSKRISIDSRLTTGSNCFNFSRRRDKKSWNGRYNVAFRIYRGESLLFEKSFTIRRLDRGAPLDEQVCLQIW